MRIIVTSKGTALVKELSDMNDDLLITRHSNNKKKNKILSPIPQKDNESMTNRNDYCKSFSSSFASNSAMKSKGHKMLKGELLEKLEKDQTAISPEELRHAKMISITVNKLQFTKQMTDKYIYDKANTTSNSNAIINSSNLLPSLNLPMKGNSTDAGPTGESYLASRTKFTIKDILNESSYKALRSSLIKENSMKNKQSKIDETKFRTSYEEKNILEKMEDLLSKKINPDRTNLIRYIHEKPQMSEVLLKKISGYDEEKINHVNKICQIVLHKKDNERLMKDIIQNKIIAKGNKARIDFQKEVSQMESDIVSFEGKLNNYQRNVDNKEIYRDIHKDFTATHWSKYNFLRLQKKGGWNNSRMKVGNSNSTSNSNSPQTLPPLTKLILTETSEY